MRNKYLLLLLIGALVFAGLVRAQDDDDDVPIQPGGTLIPSPTFTPSPTAPLLPTQTATPAAPVTQVVTVSPTTGATSTGTQSFTVQGTSTVTPSPAAISGTPAATIEATPEPFRVIIDVDSAFIRENPAPDSPPSASAFRDDVLQVIGRNLDGKYFEVVRPYRPEQSLGWVSIEVLDYEFLPELLPLTDIETGLQGSNPLDSPVDFGVFIVEGVALRTLPDIQRGERQLNIPPNVVVPVLARYREGEWLLVNYLGTEGWIIGFVIRDRDGILDLPEITGLLPNDDVQLFTEIIPPEIQREQLERLRTYAEDRVQIARDLEGFWWLVQKGEVLPCNPPDSIVEYLYTPRDVQQLPEIDRYIPRMNQGVELLNESADTIRECGVIDPFDVQRARNAAINAKVILDNTLVQLDNLEEIIEFAS